MTPPRPSLNLNLQSLLQTISLVLVLIGHAVMTEHRMTVVEEELKTAQANQLRQEENQKAIMNLLHQILAERATSK